MLKRYQLLHHLYAAWGQYREPLQPNQRTAKDLFIAEDLRQSLQKRTEATLATFPSTFSMDMKMLIQVLLIYTVRFNPSFEYCSFS